ncbi:winged helix-turn-helix transcriptional regulator [Methanocella arvoryzae]|nr:winged helix-turn-helix transcriptional regulator [Methanocella arvoryzae]
MKRGHIFELSLVLAIFVLACLLYVLTVPPEPVVIGWSNNTGWSPDYMTVGSNDTLYEFKGNEIRAISSDGNFLWSLDVPSEWSVLNNYNLPGNTPEGYGYFLNSYPVMAESDGSLYLFAFKRLTWQEINSEYGNTTTLTIVYDNTTNIFSVPADHYLSQPGKVLKISSEGRVEWEYQFNMTLSKNRICGLSDPRYYYFEHPVKITERAGKIYFFHDNTEDVLDPDGRLLFSIRNLSSPGVIDNTGRIYAVQGTRLEVVDNAVVAANGQPLEAENEDWYAWKFASDPASLLPTGTLQAWDAEGKFLWSTDIGEPAICPVFRYDVWEKYYSLPLYTNGTIYVPIDNGVTAVSPEGKVLWSYTEPAGEYLLYEVMPLDSKGNIYLRKAYPAKTNAAFLKLSCLTIVGPDGKASADRWPFYQSDPVDDLIEAPLVISGYDGIVYATGASKSFGLNLIESGVFNEIYATKSYPADTITAYDVKNGTALWHFTVPLADVHALTLNRENIPTIIEQNSWAIGELNGSSYVFGDRVTERYTLKCFYLNNIAILRGTDTIYVNYYFSVSEAPYILNVSRCVYAKGLYALDDHGKLLWKQPIDGFVTGTAVNNSTIYYRTSDGTVGKGTVNIAAGMALAAIAYLILRFFMIGAVSRAKSQLDRNENRNQVLNYVTARPGSTANEICRGLGMNLGTIRYHLLILSLNHRIVSHPDGDKYVRYFKNSGTFTAEEQSLHSLMRREPVRRTLQILAEKPGISGSELSRELGVSDTAAYRHVNLLVEKGIVIKGAGVERGVGYTIKAEYVPFVTRTSEK